ncbi:Reverse transcriptase domain [Cinara cedri]|uniref:Reverse transcriptase domain n=1 Tax=Cinara cedri TaxID=506608 RepID=A0A5E4NKH0_9HEMI|nr:Reverse transcriptase domain [Cinara cedri]
MKIEVTLPKEQAGFRQNRSSCEQVLSMVTHVENGFQERKKSGAIFLNLTCAYDTVWKRGLLLKLANILNCKMTLRLIGSMLPDRKFRVHLNGNVSKYKYLQNDLTQGSVLSPIFFNAYTADLTSTILRKFIYADDVGLVAQVGTFEWVENILNEDLAEHLEGVKGKLKTRNNIISKLAGTSWGCRATILRISSLALVYSVAEYCAPVWARSTHNKTVDTQLNRTMRIISGCIKSTNPPEVRRHSVELKMIEKIQISLSLPIYDDLYNAPNKRLKSRNPIWTLKRSKITEGDLWKLHWKDGVVLNNHLISDPTELVPGFVFPHTAWTALNHVRTGQRRCNYLMHKWGMVDSPLSRKLLYPHQWCNKFGKFCIEKLRMKGFIIERYNKERLIDNTRKNWEYARTIDTSIPGNNETKQIIDNGIELLDILENGTFTSDDDFSFDSNEDVDRSFDDDELGTGNLPDENEINNVDNYLCSVDNLLSYYEKPYD